MIMVETGKVRSNLEDIERSIKRMDSTLIIVSSLVFICLTITTIYSIVLIGTAGIVFMLICWIVTIATWTRILKVWIDERVRLIREKLEHRTVSILEEISKLRESIEALRKSLES